MFLKGLKLPADDIRLVQHDNTIFKVRLTYDRGGGTAFLPCSVQELQHQAEETLRALISLRKFEDFVISTENFLVSCSLEPWEVLTVIGFTKNGEHFPAYDSVICMRFQPRADRVRTSAVVSQKEINNPSRVKQTADKQSSVGNEVRKDKSIKDNTKDKEKDLRDNQYVGDKRSERQETTHKSAAGETCSRMNKSNTQNDHISKSQDLRQTMPVTPKSRYHQPIRDRHLQERDKDRQGQTKSPASDSPAYKGWKRLVLGEGNTHQEVTQETLQPMSCMRRLNILEPHQEHKEYPVRSEVSTKPGNCGDGPRGRKRSARDIQSRSESQSPTPVSAAHGSYQRGHGEGLSVDNHTEDHREMSQETGWEMHQRSLSRKEPVEASLPSSSKDTQRELQPASNHKRRRSSFSGALEAFLNRFF